MAPSRRALPPKAYAESDSDTDQESTPKPKRTGVKRRVSDFRPDASFTTDTRVPLKTVNINDDAAERRMRRKSAKMESLQARRSLEGLSQEQDSGGTPKAARQRQIETVAPPEAINVPLDVMSSNFEEWMKMATDNVCILLESGHFVFTSDNWTENQCNELMELCPYRLLS
jgi:condensin complex subunit 2